MKSTHRAGSQTEPARRVGVLLWHPRYVGNLKGSGLDFLPGGRDFLRVSFGIDQEQLAEGLGALQRALARAMNGG